jgi:uncharacterized protein YaeQ
MVLKSTIYKADCQIDDMDRGYYQPHYLTIALHPSETEERMMERFNNLTVINLPKSANNQLALLVKRSMQIQINRQDGQIWISDGQQTVHIEPEIWLA